MAENGSHVEAEDTVIPTPIDAIVQQTQLNTNAADKKRSTEHKPKDEKKTLAEEEEDREQKPDKQTTLEHQAERLNEQPEQQLEQQPRRTTEEGLPEKDAVHNQPQLQPLDTQSDRKLEPSVEHASDAYSVERVFKKTSPNNKLTLYLVNRDLIVSESKIDKLQGVLLVDPDYVQDKRVYGQVTLTFRYGREDEEVMGLKFCNEAVMCLAQLYPPYTGPDHQDMSTPLQKSLVKRLGPNAHAFTMEITPLAPPSVQLVPAKEYNGAPIGTSYDVKAYIAERADERFHRKTTVQMSIRVIQRTSKPPLPIATMYTVPPTSAPSITSRIQPCKTKVMFAENEILDDDENTGPHAAVEKPFLLSDGRVSLESKLDRSVYAHGDTITVHVTVNNNSSKSVRRIKVFVVQHVDVCMFSNGKFKNVVAVVSSSEGCPVGPGSTLKKTYTLRPIKGSTKNWIALEDSYTKAGATLASTVVCPGNGPDDRNVFAIYVSYYVKVKLLISAMGGEVSLKLPFTLMHKNTEPDLVGFPSPIRDPPKPAEKITEESTEISTEKSTDNSKRRASDQKNKENKVEDTKEKKKQTDSRIADVDLIERYDEADST